MTKKTVHMIGNAHLDPVWLWQWQEGYSEIKATFRSALDRMKEFPDFIFTCACAAYYQWVEENCPEIFAEICQRVREKRWIIAGGWWIQPDCNLPAGESFARHGLYSQRYFAEKFGVMARVGYNVDSFGHNGMIPQILIKSGMDAYVFMRPGDHEMDLPGNLFWWQSSDGSKVLTYKIPISYSNSSSAPGQSLEAKISQVNQMAVDRGMDLMNFYGVGNHGGGPTIANIQTIRKQQSIDSAVELQFSSPDQYFAVMREQADHLPVVKSDLQHHASGCYSAHSETKQNNRKSEHRLLSAEKFSVLADHLLGLSYPHMSLKDAWQKVLFNQFHDILGGCSIKEAYADAREFYGKALTNAAESLNAAVQKISWAIDTMGAHDFHISKDKDWCYWDMAELGAPLVVFNPLSWDVNTAVQVHGLAQHISDEHGQTVTSQRVRASRTNHIDKWDTLFIGRIPAMGYKVFYVHTTSQDMADTAASADDKSTPEIRLENDFLRLSFDQQTGHISEIYDKQAQYAVSAGFAAVPIVIDEADSDTWAHGVFSFRRQTDVFDQASLKIIENGPVRQVLRVTNHHGRSTLRQDFILYHDRSFVEIKAKLDWQEKHKMLKLAFPANLTDAAATYEIPYGTIERPADGEEEPAQQWVDLSGRRADPSAEPYGLSLIGDSSYSFDIKDNEIRMTVVRGAIFADHFGERDDLCEYMDQGINEFRYQILPHQGDWRSAGTVRKAYELNVPHVLIYETYHKGTMPLSLQGISISSDNVIVSALKAAEDGQGYVLRCYETAGEDTDCAINLMALGRQWPARFGRNEIKSFYIPSDPDLQISETDFIEYNRY